MLINDMAGALVYAILTLLLIIAFDYLMLWIERRMAVMSNAAKGARPRRGGHGILRDLADLVKLLSKESRSRLGQGRVLLPLAVSAMLAIPIFLILIMPLYPAALSSELGYGALAMFVVMSFAPLLTFLIGSYDSRRLDSTLAQQSALALLGYEIPLIIVVVTVAILANSYGFLGIINAQKGAWFVLMTPLGFAVFFIALAAELGRTPFAVSGGSSELSVGIFNDSEAPFYLLLRFSDYTKLFFGSLAIAVLFFGGWSGPALPPVLLLLIKSFVVAFSIVALRFAAISMKLDKLLIQSWLFLLPLSILNLIVTVIIFIG